MNGLLLPSRQRRYEFHVIMLQHPQAERAQRVVRRELGLVRQGDHYAPRRRVDCGHSRIHLHATLVQERAGLFLDERLEAPLVYRK